MKKLLKGLALLSLTLSSSIHTHLSAQESGPPSGEFHYEYDSNGNMAFDGLKGLEYHYNHLNLLEKVTQTDETGETGTVASYTRLADTR